MDIAMMQTILDDLSNAEGVRLDQPGECYGRKFGGGMMYVEFGFVEGPELTGPDNHYPNAQAQYLTCLHEIGHFHWGHTQGRPWTPQYRNVSPDWEYWAEFWDDPEAYFNNGVLRSEAQAWNYALDHCEIPSEEILPETRKFMWEICLGSYFRGARMVGFDTPGQMLYNGDRHHVKFAYGKPDQYFAQTKRRIIEGDLPSEEQSGMARPTINRTIDLNFTDLSTTSASSNTYVVYGTRG